MIKTNLKTLVSILVLALGIIGMNTKASAQPFCRGTSAQMTDGYGPCWANEGKTNWSNRNVVRQEKVNAVIEKLNLNAKQKEAWDNYQATIATHLKAMQERREIDFSTMPTLERIEKRKQFIKEHSDLMTQHLDALKAFYVTLTPEQQQILDAEIGLGKGFGYHHGNGLRRHYGRGGYCHEGTCY